jgi:hypothetical protein
MSFVNIPCNHVDLQVAEHVDLTRKYLAGSPKISFTILLRWVAAYITKNYSFISICKGPMLQMYPGVTKLFF